MRDILFIIFFTIGATALCGAILSRELVVYFENSQLLDESTASVEKLESLISDYNELLSQRENDPNVMRRVAAVTMGVDINEPNTVYPKLTANELAIAKRTVAKQLEEEKEHIRQEVPEILVRCNDPVNRIWLFISGASLVLISFVCFNCRPKSKKKKKAVEA